MAKTNLAHAMPHEEPDGDEAEGTEPPEDGEEDPGVSAMKAFHEAHQDGDHKAMHEAMSHWADMHAAKEDESGAANKPDLKNLLRKRSK